MTVDKQNGVRCYAIYGVYEGMNVGAFHQWLTDSVDILSYWNHLPALYIFKTKLFTADLTNKILPFFDGRNFVVLEIDPESVSGWMPMHTWDWFKTPAPPYKTREQALVTQALLNPPRS